MKWIASIAAIVTLALAARAQEDPGKAEIGRVEVAVYYATDGDASQAGSHTTPAPAEVRERLRKEECLRFESYRLLGSDRQPLYRSYENWAEPLKPSDEVMVRFEAQSAPTDHTAILDIELWLGRKKTIKTDARLEAGRPLFVLGPAWRNGRLIISISFTRPAQP